MKTSARLVIVGLIVAILLPVTMTPAVQAQTILTEEELTRVSSNCVSIKNTLNQLHASDALLRVNRGQIYEAMGTKLMNNFNSRLGSNSFDTRGLVVVSDSYKSKLATFRTDYQSYEVQLSSAIRIDCTQKPAEFHAAVEIARERRSKVHEDIISLNQYISDYRSAVNDFLINFDRLSR